MEGGMVNNMYWGEARLYVYKGTLGLLSKILRKYLIIHKDAKASKARYSVKIYLSVGAIVLPQESQPYYTGGCKN